MQLQRSILYLSEGALPRNYREHGVFELSTVDRYKVHCLLNFGHKVPLARDLDERVRGLVRVVRSTGVRSVLIEVPAMFCSRLERELSSHNIAPLYAVSYLKRYVIVSDDDDDDGDSDKVINAKYVLRGMVEP